MENVILPLNVDIQGDLKVRGNLPEIPRSALTQESDAPVAIPLTGFRIWDGFSTVLGSPGSDDLGLTAGAFATGCPYITAGDVKNTSATRYARTFIQLPANYVSGQTVTLRFAAGMLTTVASSSVTLDVEAYKAGRDALKTGSDLVSTAAQSINSLTFGNKDFNVTATSLSAGDWLDVRIVIASVDSATATAVTPSVAIAELLVDTKG